MGNIPVLPTFTAGQVLTASDLNSLNSALNFWASPPRVLVYKSTTQSITSGTSSTLVTWDTEQFDTDLMHDNATNNSRLICKTPGYYAISAAVAYGANTSGNRTAQVRLNAAGSNSGGTALYDLGIAPPSGAQGTVIIPSFTYALAQDDYIELFSSQNSGGSLSIQSGLNNSFFTMQLVASP